MVLRSGNFRMFRAAVLLTVLCRAGGPAWRCATKLLKRSGTSSKVLVKCGDRWDQRSARQEFTLACALLSHLGATFNFAIQGTRPCVSSSRPFLVGPVSQKRAK